MSLELTKDAKAILYSLYKEYENKIKTGDSRIHAKNIGSAEAIKEQLFPDKLVADIEDLLRELDRNGFLDITYADNIPYYGSLSDYAISTMESQTKETLLSIADFVSKFIP